MPDPTAFVRIGAASNPVFSRDGQTLFHLRGAGTPQLWRIGPDGAEHPLTNHDEKVAFIRRAPTDDRLIYGIDRGGDEHQQLWLFDPTNDTSRALTDAPDVIHDFGAWSPDGTRIAFAANDRTEADFDILVMDLATGQRHRVAQGHRQTSISGWSAQDKLLLLEDRGYGNVRPSVLNLASGERQAIPQPGPTIWQTARWSADGRSILVLTDHGGSDFLHLCRLDPETGLVTDIYSAPDRDVDAWALSSDQRFLATIENDRGFAVVRLGPLDGDRPAVTGLPQGMVADLAFSQDGERLAVSASSPTDPQGLWVIQNGAARPIWRPETDQPLQPYELVEWHSADKRLIPGWLAHPAGNPPRSGWPAVIWVHGGPVGQTRPNFRPDIQMLLAQGFAVLMPNVRGSSGYGRAWLAHQPSSDPDRIGVMGQSYGGFMVLSAITEYPDLWRAAVNYYGIADFVTTLRDTGSWRREHRAAEYGTDPDVFARISPIHRAERITVPLLVLHGIRDPRVPLGESHQIVKRLRGLGKPVEYLEFDYAGHGFIRADDRMRAYTAVADFFHRHLTW